MKFTFNLKLNIPNLGTSKYKINQLNQIADDVQQFLELLAKGADKEFLEAKLDKVKSQLLTTN